MWPIRGYHIRWAFSACIAALVGYVAYRQYYLTTPRGQLEACIDFLQTADSVELESVNPATITQGVDAAASPNTKSHFVIDQATRARVVNFLRSVALEQHAIRSQPFEPQCDLRLIKGSREKNVSFCFSCNELQISGESSVQRIAIRAVDPSEIESIFGLSTASSP